VLVGLFAIILIFLVAVVLGFLAQPTSTQAQQPNDMRSALYRWLDKQPPLPQTACDQFTPPFNCQPKLLSAAADFEGDFAGFVNECKSEEPQAVWQRKGADFPKYDSITREFVFPFQMEGPIKGNAATCIALRIITGMPPRITTGVWPDEGSAGTPKKPFTDPCLRSPDWTARVKVDGDEARRWTEKAKQEGWRLEAFFHLEEWQSPLRKNWNDGHLGAEDFVKERLIHLIVDEVWLIVGNEIVHVWR